MFTVGDMLAIDYFDVIKAEDDDFELISKNTKNTWKILRDGKYYVLYLAKDKVQKFQAMGYFERLLDVVLDIIKIDDLKLKIKLPRERKNRRVLEMKSLADILVEAYAG
ncbi:MAG: hypothetical protein K6F75_11945 [Butyrivibrio sp.]|nr:hypothetical protein [Butyrivibrio sp.]